MYCVFIEEDPPEYDVKEKLKVYNEELAKDPTPLERRKDSKVGFKDTLVDLVVPPSDDDETPRPSDKEKEKSNSETSGSSFKAEDNTNKNNNNGEKIVIEQGGKFEVVSSDDVRAKEYGLPQYIDESLNEDNKENNSSVSSSSHKPTPPSNPRPNTASNSSRRVVRPGSTKPRAQSAQPTRSNSGNQRPLENFSYNSPYAMTPEQKKLLKQQQEAKERRKQEEKRRKEEEEHEKERDNEEIFQSWWSKKSKQLREQRKQEEEERRHNEKHDRVGRKYSDFVNKKMSPICRVICPCRWCV